MIPRLLRHPLKWGAAACLALTISLAVQAPAHAAVPTLNLFIWSDYIDPALLKAFEAKCNCKVVETDYESNAEMAAKLKAGGDAQYDIAVPSSYEVPQLAAEGLIQPIDHAALTNFGNLMPRFQDPDYDQGDKYSIPYQWGTTGLLYDPAKIKDAPDSWSLLFDPKVNSTYPFVMPKGEGRDQIGAACAYLGYGLNCDTKAEWIAAAKLIIATKKRPNFAGFVEETPARDQMKSGLIAVSMAYNGDIGQCYADGTCKTLKYFIPKEGGEIWVDTMTITAHSAHPKLALEFINFILDAKNGAQLSNFNQYASPNAASAPMLSDTLKTPMFTPDEAEMKKLSFLKPLVGSQLKLFNSIWTSVLK
jgi:spermidine/putrescine transport system substrate-binding protein